MLEQNENIHWVQHSERFRVEALFYLIKKKELLPKVKGHLQSQEMTKNISSSEAVPRGLFLGFRFLR